MTKLDNIIKYKQNFFINKDVLEIGCGSAELSLKLLEKSKSIKCLDIEDVRITDKVKSNVEFIKSDASNTGLTENSFDTVVAYNAAGHFVFELEEIVKESYRITKPNGNILFISTWNLDKEAILEVIPEIASNYGYIFEVEKEPYYSVTISK